MEIESLAELDDHLDSGGPLSGLRLQDLDLSGDAWPAYMDAPTAARYLGVSEQRVRKLQARRMLPVIQEARGHRVTFARTDLDQLASTWRVEAVTPRS